MCAKQGGPEPENVSSPPAPAAAFVLTDTYGFTIGSALATFVSQQLRSAASVPVGLPVAEGPQFVYDQNPSLFLGRHGRGPLRVAWDTNLLIDYFEHGPAIWQAAEWNPAVQGEYRLELEALQIIMAIWVMRDVRFFVLDETLRDSRRALSARTLEHRRVAWQELANAVRAIEARDEARDLPTLVLPDSALKTALQAVPPGADRRLASEAVRRSMHVLLTRDKGVMRAAPAVRPFGLFIGSPQDLLGELTAAGALLCLLDPKYAYWPLPDPERSAYLYRATLADEYRLGSLSIRENASVEDERSSC